MTPLTVGGRRLAVLAGALCVLAQASCSRESRPPVYPVSGTVTFQKKPAAKAVVVLRPASSAKPTGPVPHGEVGADGTFRIGTFADGDGAPAGDYVVTITWPEARTDKSGDEVVTDRLAGRFGDPAKSPWKVTVREGDNPLDPFRLD